MVNLFVYLLHQKNNQFPFKVGTETALQSESSEVSVYHFRCRFCPYAYVSTSGIVLEQHVRMLHQIEIASARAKANQKLQEEAKGNFERQD